jgi:putative membrane protein
VIEMMWWFGSGMNVWGYGLMTVSMVLFWGLVIFGVVALVRYLSHNDRASAVSPTPEELLAERFARGEIDDDEYRHRLDVLADRLSRPTKP